MSGFFQNNEYESFSTTAEADALVAYLMQEDSDVIEVHRVFQDLGLAELSGNYTNTQLEGCGDAFLVIAALAVLIVESSAQVEAKEKTQISTALKYFALAPEDHWVSDRFNEDELSELADLSEQLRLQLDA